MSHSSVIGNMQQWKLHTTPQAPQKLPTVSYHRGCESPLSRGTHTLLESQKKKMCLTQKSPPASSVQSNSLVKIFWNLQSNFCLCGWSVLLRFVLTTVTLNLRNEMMAMIPLTVFSWTQSQIGDEWEEKALGWPGLWTSQKLLPHSRGCPRSPTEKRSWADIFVLVDSFYL